MVLVVVDIERRHQQNDRKWCCYLVLEQVEKIVSLWHELKARRKKERDIHLVVKRSDNELEKRPFS